MASSPEELQEELESLAAELAGLLPVILVVEGSLTANLDLVADEYRMAVADLADDATEAAKEFYDSLPTTSSYRAQSFDDPTLAGRLEASARYAIASDEVKAVESQLARTGTRAIFDQSRSTLISNVEREGGKWYRIPSADACGFCRILGSRGPVYKSSHAAAASHDDCKCRVDVERPGMRHSRPSYMSTWDDDYRRHRASVIRSGENPTMNNIANSWNRELFASGVRSRTKSATPAIDVDARDVA